MIWFFNTPWPSLALCAALSLADYYMTIAGARLYRTGARQFIMFDGSYELNTRFQGDIDQLRWISPRFLLGLSLLLGVIAQAWWLTVLINLRQIFLLYLGIVVGVQMAIHKRHLTNVFLFRAVTKPGAVSGQITYSRPLVLKQSAVDMLAFSALFLLLSVFTWNLFPLGAALGCLVLALRHLLNANKAVPSTTVSAGTAGSS